MWTPYLWYLTTHFINDHFSYVVHDSLESYHLPSFEHVSRHSQGDGVFGQNEVHSQRLGCKELHVSMHT